MRNNETGVSISGIHSISSLPASVQNIVSVTNYEAQTKPTFEHLVGFSEVLKHSPTLADRRAVSTDKGLANVAERIVEVIRLKQL